MPLKRQKSTHVLDMPAGAEEGGCASPASCRWPGSWAANGDPFGSSTGVFENNGPLETRLHLWTHIHFYMYMCIYIHTCLAILFSGELAWDSKVSGGTHVMGSVLGVGSEWGYPTQKIKHFPNHRLINKTLGLDHLGSKLFVSVAGIFSRVWSMALKRAKKFTPLLAHKWERIGRVRSRFRRGSSWLKFAKGHKGHNVVQCTASLGCNFEVLATALETCGLQLQSVKAMEKEVGDFPLSMHTYIHTYIYIFIHM